MKMRFFVALCAIVTIMAMTAMAADVTGKWTAEVQGRNGTQTRTFNLKADGAKLTGTVSGMGGRENEISDGKVNGDEITFTTTVQMQGNEMKINYVGKVSGDEIKFTQSREGSDRKQEFTAKRATT